MKRGINSWTIVGNVGKDPELRYTPDGTSVCNFSVAVNNFWKDQSGNEHESVEWVYVVAWKGLADFVGQYMRGGAPVYVQGRAKTRKYEHEGVTKYKTELVAERVIPFGGNRSSGAPVAEGDEEPAAPGKAEDGDLPF